MEKVGIEHGVGLAMEMQRGTRSGQETSNRVSWQANKNRTTVDGVGRISSLNGAGKLFGAAKAGWQDQSDYDYLRWPCLCSSAEVNTVCGKNKAKVPLT